jgi:hypothetical protein
MPSCPFLCCSIILISIFILRPSIRISIRIRISHYYNVVVLTSSRNRLDLTNGVVEGD